MQDNNLKERIESLNPLSAGVVFGKEDAWDKLQARMDAPPKRKILPVYWWAAAAILLIAFGTALMFRQQVAGSRQFSTVNEQPTVNNRPNDIITPETTSTTAPVMPPVNIAETPVTMKTNTITPTVTNKELHIDNIAPIVAVQQETATPLATANVQVPAIVIKQPMKVVHINELDKEGNSTRTATVNNDAEQQDIAMNKLPVVHINNVLKEERRQTYNIQETKNPVNVFSFMKPGHQYSITANDDLLKNNSVKIKLKYTN